ncbi:MAG: DUF6671 family protein [Candidatus Competibacterales bacterium]
MSQPFHPYCGRRAVLATMHRKQEAIAPPLASQLGLVIEVPDALDTDRLGTFTGEVERPGPMLETAIAKARAGMAASGLPLGLASEGSYGPHPSMPFIPAGIELLVWVDDERPMVLTEHVIDEQTNYHHVIARPGTDIGDFLTQVRFPSHGLIACPHTADHSGRSTFGPIVKGLQTEAELYEAIARCSRASPEGAAMVQTDMRAHRNPTRMATLGRLAERLAQRLARLCQACGAPGFGLVGVEKGLPCGWCGYPSNQVQFEIWGCGVCDHREQRIPPGRPETADPGYCDLCNP